MATLGGAYNLQWACVLPSDSNATPVALSNQNTLDQGQTSVPGVILFPSLCTPLIIAAASQSGSPATGSGSPDPSADPSQDSSTDPSQSTDPLPAATAAVAQDNSANDALRAQLATADRVEVLLMTKGAAITPDVVNQRLKVISGDHAFDPAKPVLALPLFDALTLGNNPDLIKVTTIGSVTPTTVVQTASGRFNGLIDTRVLSHYSNLGYSTLVSISVDATMLAPPQTPDGQAPAVPEDQNKFNLSDATVSPYDDRTDDQDKIVFDFVKVAAVTDPRVRQMQYAFQVQDDVVVGTADPSTPVIAFHPVFFYTSLTYANLGHVSDIHCSARQQILMLSQAHVIESGVVPVTGGDPVPGQPNIGSVVNIYSRNCLELLRKMQADDNVDVIVIGGDLLDHANSAIPTADASLSVAAIWNLVDCSTLTNYFDNPDLNSFYSMLVKCIQQSPAKPFFAVTGNHDAYNQSFGISPRVLGIRRANEGIPADHNLSIYEAILCFGSSYGKINSGFSSSFNKDRLKWFYMVFTPFSDYTIELPNQKMICLGWGEDEVLLTSSGQGFGHLPRANTVCNDAQLQLVNNAVGGPKKIILTTHFTFISYDNYISNMSACNQADALNGGKADKYKAEECTVRFDGSFTHCDMGTFEKGRPRFYQELFAQQRAVQLVLTGHSHRRGFHTIRNVLGSGGAVATCMSDFPAQFDGGLPSALSNLDQQTPFIILSDCAGPLPRRSVCNEFKGWGSDRPAGTRIQFDQDDGVITSITAIQCDESPRTKPRIAVAIDYLDVEKETPVFQQFATTKMKIDDQKADSADYVFNVQLNSILQDGNAHGVMTISRIIFYWCRRAPGQDVEWKMTELNSTGNGYWTLPSESRTLFRTEFAVNRVRESYAAVYFAGGNDDIQSVYDFSSPWTFEVTVSDHKDGFLGIGSDNIWFTVERDSHNKEFPDLDRRGAYPEYQSATPASTPDPGATPDPGTSPN